MQTDHFNENAVSPQYGYAPCAIHPRAFKILKQGDGATEPVGDYIVLDGAEDLSLSEKKVVNIVSLLNGRRKLMQLGHETKSRILYRIVTSRDENGYARVLFYTLGQEGNSVENAILQIKGEEHAAEIIV